MTVNTLKIRDHQQPLKFTTESDSFKPQDRSQAAWLSTRASFGEQR